MLRKSNVLTVLICIVFLSIALPQDTTLSRDASVLEELEKLQGDGLAKSVALQMANPTAKGREEMMIYGYARGLGSNILFRSCIRIMSNDECARIRRRAIHLIRRMGDRESDHILLDALDDQCNEVKLAAIWAIEARSLSEAQLKLKNIAEKGGLSSDIREQARRVYQKLLRKDEESGMQSVGGEAPKNQETE